ncbi:class II peroxidase [Auriscalpium vulgare]|uniref:Class II peroxidase n=1 Tax=Auriscalpium vulgare TaxID=40419 RepID=A0ACB8RBD2_9AGAM|nr:class II peroxidase [Auriscalpium vulgare]
MLVADRIPPHLILVKLAAAAVVLTFFGVSDVLGATVPKASPRGACDALADARCCKWLNIAEDLQANLFEHSCDEDALEAIRLAFHDGIGRSRAMEWNQTFWGGADGSILKFSDIELAYPENHAVDDIVHALKPFAEAHAVGYGDLVQFAAAVGTSNCPGAPRLRFLAGRRDALTAAPASLVPSPAAPASDILLRMHDAGFTSDDLVALLAAHSVGRQRTLDPTAGGLPLDSTPEAFDTQFYLDVLLAGTRFPGNGSHYGEARSPLETQFRLISDAEVARHPLTACAWQSFINRQDKMMDAFRDAMLKLSVNGQDLARLVDCSEVIPPAPLQYWTKPIAYPPGTGPADVDRTCFDAPFPSLSASSRNS